MHPPAHPQLIRRIAAGVAAAVAAVYLLIALDVVTVLEGQAAESPAPPAIAAVLFAALAVVLVRSDRRSVLVAGVVLQVLAVAVYLMVSVERTPAFEAWGVGLKVVQLGLLVALGSLLPRPSRRPRAPRVAH